MKLGKMAKVRECATLFAFIFFLAHVAWAADAIWIGGASGYLNDSANWDGDITASDTTMMFTNDCIVSLSADQTVNSVFSDNTADTGDKARRFDRNVTINLNGHTLKSNGVGSKDRHPWRARGSTMTFTGGMLENVQDGGTTNIILADVDKLSCDEFLTATGSGTKVVSSFETRVHHSSRPDGGISVLDGAQWFGNAFSFCGNASTNVVSGGASLYYGPTVDWHDYPSVGVGQRRDTLSKEDGSRLNLLRISGGTVAPQIDQSGNVTVGYMTSHDDKIIVENGGTLTVGKLLVIGNGTAAGGGSSNNTVLVAGSGSKLALDYANGNVAWIGKGTALAGRNTLAVENGGSMSFIRSIFVGEYGTNNMFAVRSGGVVSYSQDKGADIYLGTTVAGQSANARLEVTGAGTSFSARWIVLRNGNEDLSTAPTVFFGDGAVANCALVRFYGEGGTLCVSNASVTLTYLQPNGGNGSGVGTNATVRIEGASAAFTSTRIIAGDGTNNLLAGKVRLEFAIPEDGWAAAPFTNLEAFTIGADTILAVDAASVEAFLAAHPRGGIVPLMKTKFPERAITVADMDALAANLPGGCSLVNESGVLSVNIKPVGFSIFVR